MSKVIVVDDNRNYLETVCQELQGMGIETIACENGSKARWQIRRAGRYDVLLVDLLLGDDSGTEILRWMRNEGYPQPFYLMTGVPSMENAIETMNLGAACYIRKEDIEEQFYSKIKDIIEEQNLREKRNERFVFKRESGAFKRLYEEIKAYAKADIRVVITGERGTGRSHLAEDWISFAGLRYAPYAEVHCGSLSSVSMAAEELFGHQKGAFSSAVRSTDGKLELANGGVLFLENVDMMPIDVQEMLIPALKSGKYCRIGSNRERHVSFKLVATSTESLDDALISGKMLQEFYDCCCECTVEVPPLRNTIDDVVPLAKFFAGQFGSGEYKFSKEAKDLMRVYHWPGNVRELRKVVKVAVAKCQDGMILPEHLTIRLSSGQSEGVASRLLHDPLAEKSKIEEVLSVTGYNKSHTAEILGIDRKTLNRKIKQYGIDC